MDPAYPIRQTQSTSSIFPIRSPRGSKEQLPPPPILKAVSHDRIYPHGTPKEKRVTIREGNQTRLIGNPTLEEIPLMQELQMHHPRASTPLHSPLHAKVTSEITPQNYKIPTEGRGILMPHPMMTAPESMETSFTENIAYIKTTPVSLYEKVDSSSSEDSLLHPRPGPSCTSPSKGQDKGKGKKKKMLK
jgi:hypothetical protein